MAERFRRDAREWLKADTNNWIYDHSKDEEHGPALVEDLYRVNAVKVEVGLTSFSKVLPLDGSKEFSNECDTLFVTLPKGRDEAIKVMALLAWQQGDEVEIVDGEKDVVRIWWD